MRRKLLPLLSVFALLLVAAGGVLLPATRAAVWETSTQQVAVLVRTAAFRSDNLTGRWQRLTEDR